jgi:hypothetical protein
MLDSVPPAGFEPALTAPEAAAACVSELGKRARWKPPGGVTGAGMLLMAATAAVHSFGADVLLLGELVQEDLLGDEADAEFAGGAGFA